MSLFDKEGDYYAFVKLMDEGRSRTAMRILGWCLMPNHWHMVLWPRYDGDLARFVGWVSTTHVRRWRAHRDNVGEGHLYQGRYKSFIVQTDGHLLTVLRYVEQNPLRAGLTDATWKWPWSSAASRPALVVDDWPVQKPADWATILESPVGEVEKECLRTSLRRGRPYGNESWVQQTAEQLSLWHTVRNPWRPRQDKGDIPPYATGNPR